MLELLYKYLILYKKAAIPGIGVFHIDRRPAFLDLAHQQLVAPSNDIKFTVGATDNNHQFYLFLAKEKGIEEAEAINNFSHFTYTIAENLKATGKVELTGLGVLLKDDAGSIRFEAANQPASFFVNVAAERTLHNTHEEEAATTAETGDEVTAEIVNEETDLASKKRDYWWLFALILAAIAIAAIVYYYYQNGSFR